MRQRSYFVTTDEGKRAGIEEGVHAGILVEEQIHGWLVYAGGKFVFMEALTEDGNMYAPVYFSVAKMTDMFDCDLEENFTILANTILYHDEKIFRETGIMDEDESKRIIENINTQIKRKNYTHNNTVTITEGTVTEGNIMEEAIKDITDDELEMVDVIVIANKVDDENNKKDGIHHIGNEHLNTDQYIMFKIPKKHYTISSVLKAVNSMVPALFGEDSTIEFDASNNEDLTAYCLILEAILKSDDNDIYNKYRHNFRLSIMNNFNRGSEGDLHLSFKSSLAIAQLFISDVIMTMNDSRPRYNARVFITDMVCSVINLKATPDSHKGILDVVGYIHGKEI